jgi:adenine-specific DNA-methyltransferase
VLCAAFRVPRGAGSERYPNLTVKKIPKQVLSRCEWGHDDYSLKVENLPKAPPPPPKADKKGQQSLFDVEVGK